MVCSLEICRRQVQKLAKNLIHVIFTGGRVRFGVLDRCMIQCLTMYVRAHLYVCIYRLYRHVMVLSACLFEEEGTGLTQHSVSVVLPHLRCGCDDDVDCACWRLTELEKKKIVIKEMAGWMNLIRLALPTY